MRVRDFDDPADEGCERMLGEQRDREERADRLAEKGSKPNFVWFEDELRPEVLTRLQED